jgi:hypothetical protein
MNIFRKILLFFTIFSIFTISAFAAPPRHINPIPSQFATQDSLFIYQFPSNTFEFDAV